MIPKSAPSALLWNAVAVMAPHIPPRLRAGPSTLSWRDSRRRVPSRLPLTVETYARHRDPRRADRRIARGFAAPAPPPPPPPPPAARPPPGGHWGAGGGVCGF